MADVHSDEWLPLLTSTDVEQYPAVSPDGTNLLFTRPQVEVRIVSLSVENGSAQTLIEAGRGNGESMAAWSANQATLTWNSSRNAPSEIWIRARDGSERPVVSRPYHIAGTANPALSPEGDRLIFGGAQPPKEEPKLWITSLSGGSPIRLTNAETTSEFGGSWSPDGSQFVYLQSKDGNPSLMVARTNGGVKPVLLKDNVKDSLPDWSRVGNWITYRDEKGWNLISPDGKNVKRLGDVDTPYLVFSKDGKVVYGIEPNAEDDRSMLFSLDLATLKRRTIKQLGKELQPLFGNKSTRFSLAPDGKSFAYSTFEDRDDIWMLKGYGQPGWFNQIFDTFKNASLTTSHAK